MCSTRRYLLVAGISVNGSHTFIQNCAIIEWFTTFGNLTPSTNVTVPFEMNSLRWRMQREGRTLRLFTVEAHNYSPAQHASILFGAVTRLKSGGGEVYGGVGGPLPSAQFDLLVFPEVFLASADLITLVESLSSAGPTGCIHTGIRPDTGSEFLFTREQAISLSKSLVCAGGCAADLAAFNAWIGKQGKTCFFNLGAVVAVDVDGKVRIALQPKVLRSKYELSTFAASNMTEAKFLTLITLVPSEPTLLPVTLQPLLCSDALVHSTELPGTRPIDAISRYGNSFTNSIPDYVDIVSLATCSPHPNSAEIPLWHIDFREGFLRMAKDDANFRHRHAVLVMANFVQIPDSSRIGGLSGAFLPVPLYLRKQPDYVVAPEFATLKTSLDPAWHLDREDFSRKFAHMVCLRPPTESSGAVATIFGFDLHCVLKDTNQYNPPKGLSNYQRMIGFIQPDGAILFS